MRNHIVPTLGPIPLADFGRLRAQQWASQLTYVICQSGARSLRAVEALTARGIDAVNVEGGTSAWLLAGLPSEGGR